MKKAKVIIGPRDTYLLPQTIEQILNDYYSKIIDVIMAPIKDERNQYIYIIIYDERDPQ